MRHRMKRERMKKNEAYTSNDESGPSESFRRSVSVGAHDSNGLGSDSSAWQSRERRENAKMLDSNSTYSKTTEKEKSIFALAEEEIRPGAQSVSGDDSNAGGSTSAAMRHRMKRERMKKNE